MSSEQSNHLATETSPYLLQHARNPVHWYPWGPEALQKAQAEDKPILLSIGYSACHWCHVMAHESFEDGDTARVMNELFINIKVDREERPDLDKIYQVAHQLLTQRGGGWPLTMFLSPHNHVPFFGGTYFPRESRYGLPSFQEVLRRVADFYRDHRAEIEKQNRLMVEALGRLKPGPAEDSQAITAEPLDLSRTQLSQIFDKRHGGFGDAPKFPHPPHLAFLMRHWAATALGHEADNNALDMVTVSLDRMAQGGLYDHLGGGFYRYSVDEQWAIPHFEKMLYDNSQLLMNYVEAYRITGEESYAVVAHETARWVMREMQSPQGGYYATLDADSEGEEGKFYVWSQDELRALLDEQEYQAASRHFGLDQPANFEGKWHLQVSKDAEAVAAELSLPPAHITSLLASARARMLQAREQRVRPRRDEKILTAWNGLMIKAMAMAGRYLDCDEYIASAEQALTFIQENVWQDSRLLASYKDGRARHTAYLDDYVFLLDGVLELLQARWVDGELRYAATLAEVVLHHYEDPEHGGFFFTADDHEALIQRPKPVSDDALPSGNGVAAQVLARLGHLLAEPRYLDAAARTIKGAWSSIMHIPYAHNALLLAVDEYLSPPQLIILRGEPLPLVQWQERCDARYAPRRLVFPLPATARGLWGLLEQCAPRGEVTAYVCQGLSCSAPVTKREDLEALLAESELAVPAAPRDHTAARG